MPYAKRTVQSFFCGNAYCILVPAGCVQYFRSPSSLVRSFNYGPETDKVIRYPANTRYAVCLRVEENFCSIKWETETAIMRYPSGFEGNRTSFSFGRSAIVVYSEPFCCININLVVNINQFIGNHHVYHIIAILSLFTNNTERSIGRVAGASGQKIKR